jgi:hypothetical protein
MREKLGGMRTSLSNMADRLRETTAEDEKVWLRSAMKRRSCTIALLEWWFSDYDGGPRCRDGHSADEVAEAITRFMPKDIAERTLAADGEFTRG